MITRRLAAIATSAAVLLLFMPTTSADAARPSPRPQVTIGALTGPVEGPEGTQEYWLEVDAVDPDGVIWEVTMRWSDRLVTWASTGCVQGTDPGTPAHLIIPHEFAKPGRYVVQVEATSLHACPWVAPGGSSQESHVAVKMFTISG